MLSPYFFSPKYTLLSYPGYKMPYSLRNRNVLVVAGSRGVGAMIAVKFAKEGANLAITYIGSHTRAEQVAKECEGHGAKTVVLQADGGKASDMERIVKETKDGLGGLDVIIGNQVSLSNLSRAIEYVKVGLFFL